MTPVCKDCKVNIYFNSNMVMLNDDLWKKVCDRMSDLICDECIEKRMGRKISWNDFKKPSVEGMKIIPCNRVWLKNRRNKNI